MLKVGTDLYRQLLVQARRLPDERASSFYRQQVQSTFRQAKEPESSEGAVRRLHKANKLLRHLQAANDGYLHALTRMVNIAYGRTGRGKHLALNPFLPPQTNKPPTTFTPLLRALLGSSIAHTTKPPTPAQLTTPPSLPPRAVPGSEAARLLGQLPLQRERAVRGRYWREQVGKLRAPIAVVGTGGEGECVREQLRAAGIGKVDLELGQGRLRVLEELSRVPSSSQPKLPRRLQRSQASEQDTPPPAPIAKLKLGKDKPQRKEPTIHPPQVKSTKWHNPKILTARLLRRRYAKLLFDAPIVEVSPLASDKPAPEDASSRGKSALAGQVKVSVRRSEWAKDGVKRMSVISEEDAWFVGDVDQLSSKKGAKRDKKAPKGKADSSPR